MAFLSFSKVVALLCTSLNDTGFYGMGVGVGCSGVAEGMNVRVGTGAGWHAVKKPRMIIVVTRIFLIGFLLSGYCTIFVYWLMSTNLISRRSGCSDFGKITFL
jgi:hypothetical protein